MNLDDQIPIFILHILEANIPQNARIIDQDVNPSKILDGCLNDTLAIDHIVVVRNRFPARSSDLVDDHIGGL